MTTTRAAALIRPHYQDFGLTLAAEKLAECHGQRLAKETVRRIMMDAGLWTTRRQRPPEVYQPRHRRACLGKLFHGTTGMDGNYRYATVNKAGTSLSFPGASWFESFAHWTPLADTHRASEFEDSAWNARGARRQIPSNKQYIALTEAADAAAVGAGANVVGTD